jgi:hypothetical protein
MVTGFLIARSGARRPKMDARDGLKISRSLQPLAWPANLGTKNEDRYNRIAPTQCHHIFILAEKEGQKCNNDDSTKNDNEIFGYSSNETLSNIPFAQGNRYPGPHLDFRLDKTMSSNDPIPADASNVTSHTPLR